jgi:hypothetical protein
VRFDRIRRAASNTMQPARSVAAPSHQLTHSPLGEGS